MAQDETEDLFQLLDYDRISSSFRRNWVYNLFTEQMASLHLDHPDGWGTFDSDQLFWNKGRLSEILNAYPETDRQYLSSDKQNFLIMRATFQSLF